MVKTANKAQDYVQHDRYPERTAHTVREGFESAKDAVVDGYDKVSKKAHDVWDNVADKNINDASSSVQQYVRHNPGTCLLMAAGTGLVLGFVFRWWKG